MKVKHTVDLRIEVVSDGSGVLSLMNDGVETDSCTIYYGGNSCATLGDAVKAFIKQARYQENPQ